MQWVAATGTGLTNGSGTVHAGDTVSLTLKFSEAVAVSGAPTLSLNDKGTAKYVSGAGTDTLQFEYTVAAGQNTSDLAISSFGLSGVKDLAGNALNLSGAPRQPAGTLVVDTRTTSRDTTAPKVQWIATSGNNNTNGGGTVAAGDTVRLSVNFNEVMTVNGAPTLSLNSKGTATYVGGAGTNTLQFDYVVKAGESASDLEVSGYKLTGVTDQAGNAVNVAGAPHQPGGTLAVGGAMSQQPVVSADAPVVQWVAVFGSNIRNGHGTVGVGDTVWLSVNFDEAMSVNGAPTLSLSSGGTANDVSGAGTNTLQFKYVVGAGDNAPDLEISGYNLQGVADRTGNAVNLDGAPHQPGGVLTIATATPAVATASSQLTATLLSPAADLVVPAAATAASPATSSNWLSGQGTDLSFGNRKTVGFPGSQDAGTAAPSQGSAMSKLALLDQYAASSFATSASTSTGSAQGWWNNPAQTLAKPQA